LDKPKPTLQESEEEGKQKFVTSTFNRLTLIGRVGADPVTKTVNDAQITNFSVATDSKYDKKTDKSTAMWHNCVAYDEKVIEVLKKFVTKGYLIFHY
jgi:single stranded DNA-binding protein